MAQHGDVILVCRCIADAQFRQQSVFVQIVDIKLGSYGAGQEAWAIKLSKNGLRLGQLADLVKTHRIQALEKVTIFPMERSPSVSLVESKDVLEAGDEALFTWSVARDLDRRDCNAQSLEQLIVVEISHCSGRLVSALLWLVRETVRTRLHLRPYASPMHRRN